MARYRAIASGAWETLSIWEDNSGGSYAASSILPSSNDEVYCNGFEVNVNGTYYVKLMSNGIPDDQDENTPASETINAGGSLAMTNESNKTIHFHAAKMYNYGTFVYAKMASNRTHIIYLYGAIHNESGTLVVGNSGVNGRRITLTINGDVYGNPLYQLTGTGTTGGSLTITGNCHFNQDTVISIQNGNATATINGDVEKTGGTWYGNNAVNPTINGSFRANGNITQPCSINNGEIINAFWLAGGYTSSNISKYRIIIDNVEWYLPEYITNGLPSASDVRQGVQFGLNNEFLGTLDLPQEANVQVGVVYDNGNKTGTYNVSISPADIIAALATYGTAKASDLSGLSTLTRADITSALTTYGTAKGSDLSGLSTLTLADIATALTNYGTAKSSDLNGMSTLTLADLATALSNYGTAKASDLSGLSTLTSNDILQALADYTAVKVSDLSGISISQQDVVDALTTYGASKVSDLSSALNTYGAAKPADITTKLTAYGTAKTSDLSGLSTLTLADIATALTNYSVAKTSDLSGLSTLTANDIANALTNYGTAKSSEIENVVKEEYLSEILGE